MKQRPAPPEEARSSGDTEVAEFLPAGTNYVDFLMESWGMGEQPRRVQTCLRKVLSELCGEGLLILRNPKLEVMVAPEAFFSVWAYFPIHRRRLISQRLHPQPRTKVLLAINAARLDTQPVKQTEDELRDHFGHVLLYLERPKAHNGCVEALREWRDCTLARLRNKRRKPSARRVRNAL